MLAASGTIGRATVRALLRPGAPKDAWAIDHQANPQPLAASQAAGVEQAVRLSAICLQRPLLALKAVRR